MQNEAINHRTEKAISEREQYNLAPAESFFLFSFCPNSLFFSLQRLALVALFPWPGGGRLSWSFAISGSDKKIVEYGHSITLC